MKLAKRVTGRTKIVAFENSYHGSTQGALSIIGDEYWRAAFRPLLPGVQHLHYNSFEDLDSISENTACVIAETVQAEAGILPPQKEWLQALQQKCKETGALFILDEIQAGFGRTGKLWCFENFDVAPDVLLLGKALGGGLPLGAFVADKNLMDAFTKNPVLGHITTFGGHPVSCAAGKAAMEVLLTDKLFATVKSKEHLFRDQLKHAAIKEVSSGGLWLSVAFDSFETCKTVVANCIQRGVITDWFLFAPNRLRIAPPLIITEEEIKHVCSVIIESINARINVKE
jgi:acetylornithine/succinyldiaminopimelate/putrescine aminotransferase